MKPKPLLEKVYQLSICRYLEAKKYFFFRNNNTPIYDASRKTFRKMPAYAMKGVPDIVVFKKNEVYFLEVKRPGGKLSEHQIVFKDACNKVGIKYFVVTYIDDLVKIGL